MAGLHIASGVRICSSAKITGDGNISIGSDTWIGLNSFLMASGEAEIVVEECVDIAPMVYIGTGTHLIDMAERVAGTGKNLSIRIGRGTWIGARSVILPGVEVGEMCMIAAGSVVTSKVEPNTMVGGVPAKFIKYISRRDEE